MPLINAQKLKAITEVNGDSLDIFDIKTGIPKIGFNLAKNGKPKITIKSIERKIKKIVCLYFLLKSKYRASTGRATSAWGLINSANAQNKDENTKLFFSIKKYALRRIESAISPSV